MFEVVSTYLHHLSDTQLNSLRKQVTQAPSLTLTLTSILENIAPRVWWAAIVIIIEGPGLPSALLPISIIHHHSY